MGVDLNTVKWDNLLEVLGDGDWTIALPNGYADLVLSVAWRQQLKEIASHWFVRWVLGGVTYEISHDDDPPWDHSGEARRITVEPEVLLLRYATLEFWMDHEHTGDKRPTFESTCGWNWNTYQDDFEETISEHLFELIRAHLSRCVDDVDAIDDYSDAIGNIDIHLEYALMEIAGRIRTIDAWRKYETDVLRLLREERQAMEQRAAHYARMSQLTREFWRQHFTDIGRQKIEMPQFNALDLETRLVEILADTDPETVAAIAAVGLPIICSNSVECVIKHVAQHAMTDCQDVMRLYDSF